MDLLYTLFKENDFFCRRKTADNECSNVPIDQEVSFEVSVTAQRCSEAAKKQKR